MCFLAIASALLLGAVIPDTDGAEILCSSADLEDFADDTTRRYAPFCVTGTVLSVSYNFTNQLVFSDASGRAELRIDSDYRPVPGEIVAMTGYAHMSRHQNIDIVAREIEHIGTGSVDPPVELRLGEISESKHHLLTLVTAGTVIDSFRDEIDANNYFLILKDEDAVLPVALPIGPDSDLNGLQKLLDARVRVAGCFCRTANGDRKFSGPFISVRNLSAVTVLSPAPADPLDAPPLEKKFYRTPREVAALGKRSVTGELLAVWNGQRLMVREANGRIVNVTLAHGKTAPAPGTTVTVAGYPETDLFRLNLSRASIRTEKPAEPSEEVPKTDLQQMFFTSETRPTPNQQCHGMLLRVRGIVQSVPSPDDTERRLLLSCGPHKLPVDLGPCPRAILEDLELGTEVEVTGRGLLEIDTWHPDDIFPHIKQPTLVMRAPQDLRILARPPWWTPRKLTIVISVLLAALIAIYIWNRILRKIIHRRGRELYREQVAHAIAEFKTGERTRLAVELHDSLSQTLAGVACHLSVGGDMIDEDPETAKRCIKTADCMLSSCRTELRHCLFDLRSNTLEEPNFMTAIDRTLKQLDSDAVINVRFLVPRSLIKDSTAHAILAIIRELTGNAIRHGGANKIQVAGCIENGHIRFSVSDNGNGFDTANCNGPKQGHFGLEGIRDRIRKLGGTFTIESQPGNGARAVVTIPLPAARPKEPRKQ